VLTRVTGGCYGSAVPSEAPLEPLIDPATGIVFGYAWGSEAGEFLKDHPGAALTRDEGDVQEYVLASPIAFYGIPSHVTFQFSLDDLVAIRLDLAIPLDEDLTTHLLLALDRLFDEELDDSDDGLVSCEEGATRMAFDLYDGRITFADLDP
jgi:hypothetical protein